MKIIKYIIFIILSMGLLAVSLGKPPKIDQQQPDNSMDMTSFGDRHNLLAQTFIPSVTKHLYSIQVFMDSWGNPSDQVRMQIYTDGISKPDKLIANSTNTVSVADVQSYYTFYFPDNIILRAKNTYWMVLSRTGPISEESYYWVWGNDEGHSDPYSGGTCYVLDSTYGWMDWSYPENNAYADAYFIEYYK